MAYQSFEAPAIEAPGLMIDPRLQSVATRAYRYRNCRAGGSTIGGRSVHHRAAIHDSASAITPAANAAAATRRRAHSPSPSTRPPR